MKTKKPTGKKFILDHRKIHESKKNILGISGWHDFISSINEIAFNESLTNFKDFCDFNISIDLEILLIIMFT